MAVYYDTNVLINQVIYSVIGDFVIRRAKTSRLLPWINAYTPKINRTVAIITSAIGALGISYKYSYSSDGVLAITITGLTLLSLWEGAKVWLVSYMFQQGTYQLVTKRNENE